MPCLGAQVAIPERGNYSLPCLLLAGSAAVESLVLYCNALEGVAAAVVGSVKLVCLGVNNWGESRYGKYNERKKVNSDTVS